MEIDMAGQTKRLQFELLGEGTTLDITFQRLIIAGYTGRDASTVEAHIRELEMIGVAPPASVPMFYELSCDLLTLNSRISVSGGNTSGEVEPVIVKHDGAVYLGVGSDHTDRDLETEDIALSKAACPKPMSKQLIKLPASIDEWQWDDIAVTASADGELYQSGLLSGLRHPSDLLEKLVAAVGDLPDGSAVYAGTMPLLNHEFVPGQHWDLGLTIGPGRTISHTYAVDKE